MRYVSFSLRDEQAVKLGVEVASTIVDVSRLIAGVWSGGVPRTLLELIQQGPDSWDRLEQLTTRGQYQSDATYPRDAVRLHAPIGRPQRNVFCVGQNYIASAGKRPHFFTKATTAITGPYDDIGWDPRLATEVDWEVELAVVVGRPGKNLRGEQAADAIFGYSIINDLTARDLQREHGQSFKGKSLDGFCPMGPCVVTADEFGDPLRKGVRLTVNDVTKQDASTGSMTRSPATLLEELSEGLTLEAGDILSTGSPAGAGHARTPPEWLRDGDIVSASIDTIGSLRNQIVLTSSGRSRPVA
jgi:2-keto-4-pentenoate hydratase/2-oxohepta-3-ene-1,7-dioic acid hydratase in catechol pathway